MATGFRATSRGYRADLDAHERRILSSLCGDVIEILTRRKIEVAGDSSDIGETQKIPDQASAAEQSLFEHFRSELAGLGDEQSSIDKPQDPVVARLLPDAYSDEEQSSQFRRLSENSLRESKIADLRAARMLLESSLVTVRDDQAAQFGRALNAVRLTLATRLAIDTEEDAEAVYQSAVGESDNVDTFMAEIYTFVTWLQESLFTAMLEVLPAETGSPSGVDSSADSETDSSLDEEGDSHTS